MNIGYFAAIFKGWSQMGNRIDGRYKLGLKPVGLSNPFAPNF